MPNYDVTKNDAIERFNEISVRALERVKLLKTNFRYDTSDSLYWTSKKFSVLPPKRTFPKRKKIPMVFFLFIIIFFKRS